MAQPLEERRREQEALAFPDAAVLLVELARNFYGRGWALGTSGNFSAVVSEEPLRLAITPTGTDKSVLQPEQILQIDGSGRTIFGSGQPSEEARLHVAVVVLRGARAVLHTHSVWSTIVSETYARQRGVSIEGYEMLKGLEGVRTQEHREWLPIVDNSSDMVALAASVEAALKSYPESHGVLLRGHGLYTWGRHLAEAKRHLEILEFLLEVKGRTRGASMP